MEATWRILGFNMTRKSPSVTPLAVHLPTATNHHQYHRNSPTTTLSTLDRYFVRPQGTFVFAGQERSFADLTYSEYFTLFRVTKYDANRAGHPFYFVEQPNRDSSLPSHVILRQSDKRHLARLRDVLPSRGELFYLRTLLQHRPANSFLDARTVNGTLHNSYQQAATILGLFADEKEAEYGMREAIHFLKTPRQLRLLFVHLLVNDCILSPVDFWGIFENSLQLDFVLRLPDAPRLATDNALEEIGRYLEEHGKRLANYGLPEPHLHGREVDHEQERWGHDPVSLAARADAAAHRFNAEQRQIYDDVLAAVVTHVGLLIFVDGQAGTGKTFLVKALCDKVRSLGLIVLPTATAGYAAQHYNGGRTTHSAFKVSNRTKSIT
jgi:PIF1-like helicase